MHVGASWIPCTKADAHLSLTIVLRKYESEVRRRALEDFDGISADWKSRDTEF